MGFASFFLAALSLVSLSVSAQRAPKIASPTSKALLWQISGKQLTKPSYVFGTMHLVCADNLPVSPLVKQALANTEQLILELNTDSPTMGEEMRAHMSLPAGQTVQTCMSPQEYTTVNNYFVNELKMPFDKMHGLKPLFLATMLFPKLLGCTPGSYEMALVEAAHAQKKEVLGLETVAEQMGAFDQMPCEQQARMLVDMVGKYGEAQKEFARMAALYQAQDVEGLFVTIRDSKFGMRALEAELLTNRNKRWLPQIAEQAATKPTFFAVGAAHLGGPEGVLALLRRQGYQVKPVRTQTKDSRKTKESKNADNDAFILMIGGN